MGSKRHYVKELEYFDNWIFLKDSLREENIKFSFSIHDTSMLVHNPKEFFQKYGTDDFENRHEMTLEISYEGFKNNGTDSFDLPIGFKVFFDRYNYRIFKDRHSKTEVYKKLYSEKLTLSEIDSFVKELIRELFEDLKKRVKSSN
ncbi:hypothetical protein D3C86_1442590 [compost metagenome]